MARSNLSRDDLRQPWWLVPAHAAHRRSAGLPARLPALDDDKCHFLLAAFGAQAVLVGTVIATARFRASTFLIFGLTGSLPFFVFNAYFYYVAEVFTEWMLLDFIGNIGIFASGIIGYRLKIREESTVSQP